jgi:hypothetical protein
VGCGSDQESKIQINELQTKIMKMESEMKEIQKTHQMEMDLVKSQAPNAKLQREVSLLRSELTQMKTLMAGKDRLNEISPEAARQMQFKSRDQMRAEANRQSSLKREGFEERRAVAMVRSLLRTHKVEDIASFMNGKRVMDPNGRPWTTERVTALMKEHRLTRGSDMLPKK